MLDGAKPCGDGRHCRQLDCFSSSVTILGHHDVGEKSRFYRFGFSSRLLSPLQYFSKTLFIPVWRERRSHRNPSVRNLSCHLHGSRGVSGDPYWRMWLLNRFRFHQRISKLIKFSFKIHNRLGPTRLDSLDGFIHPRNGIVPFDTVGIQIHGFPSPNS